MNSVRGFALFFLDVTVEEEPIGRIQAYTPGYERELSAALSLPKVNAGLGFQRRVSSLSSHRQFGITHEANASQLNPGKDQRITATRSRRDNFTPHAELGWL